jgi:hypothetical protein
MARQTKEDKRIEKAVDEAFKKNSSGIQFNVMDLGKISEAGIKAGKEGKDIEAAVKEAIEKYRIK